ncbi:hypothetical protein GLOIN_2v1766080 [Rhizophagus irregularis DAOM 181602=DAOM 197198]|uniref:Uncharacterized protein n=1 Tax=Rhizophagus irregularis (strain DAOM 181602 / DAOM 197198 / MUCL 43194) TaxID=747089 RepID=A0A2P4QN16_RHIID|nr:hypothetical protein GLOIN_2v1766080 [Rhizophagus irregularis DAOM 181602=DAOM 197198]POG79032.1 hypothetical protein GLOIN_2v1766080 [Rhizophagus irregularis DAOM 181602=DAOM 197198]GET53305.1 hypothetical protein GLOIN_2v1766080 [Rhizophagus irregularis DAOM 181602=DAOM 197198]|eukprot:XP_025185898.1 hypothetical protein GLOIN_2v1766080 [Rhizophagus irregularis DAOM 181602=DAOM 197198]
MAQLNAGSGIEQEFCRTSIYKQKQIWNQSGYENLKRLLNENPEGFSTHTPTLHDEYFHEELSDEFWLTKHNYLLFN